MKLHRHRKLTVNALSLLRTEARKRAQLLSYDILAFESGLTGSSLRQLMARLIKEEIEGANVVRRGTNINAVEESFMELRA